MDEKKKLEEIAEELLKDPGNEALWKHFLRQLDMATESTPHLLSRKSSIPIAFAESLVREAKEILIDYILFDRFKPDNVAGFIYIVAKRLIKKYLNKRTVDLPEYPDHSVTPSQAFSVELGEQFGLKFRFRMVLKTLSSTCKAIMTKIYVERKELKEITEDIHLPSFAKGETGFLADAGLMSRLKAVWDLFLLYAEWAVSREEKRQAALEIEIRQALQKVSADDFLKKIESLNDFYDQIRPGNEPALIAQKSFLRELLIKSREDLLACFPGMGGAGRIAQRIRTLKTEKLQVKKAACMKEAYRRLVDWLQDSPELTEDYLNMGQVAVGRLEEPCRTILQNQYSYSRMSMAELLGFLREKFKNGKYENMTEEQLRKLKYKCLIGLDDAVFKLINS